MGPDRGWLFPVSWFAGRWSSINDRERWAAGDVVMDDHQRAEAIFAYVSGGARDLAESRLRAWARTDGWTLEIRAGVHELRAVQPANWGTIRCTHCHMTRHASAVSMPYRWAISFKGTRCGNCGIGRRLPEPKHADLPPRLTPPMGLAAHPELQSEVLEKIAAQDTNPVIYSPQHMVFVHEAEARNQIAAIEAITTAKTWGELAGRVDADVYEGILVRAGYELDLADWSQEDLEILDHEPNLPPPPDTVFDHTKVELLYEALPNLPADQLDWMPDEVRRIGRVESSMTAQSEWLAFEPKDEQRIVELLKAYYGYTVRADEELYERLLL